MKVLFALHGYPPEVTGGTELTVRAQARALAARGHEVVVCAGSMDWEGGFRTSESEDVDPATGATTRIVRIHRADLFFDHWQKSAQPGVSREFRALLERERPDVLHVQHWIRLSRDLVAVAARAGVPAVVTLHDLWTTCLLTFRIRPSTEAFCEEPLGFSPCFACAGGVPPKTPWVTLEAGAIAFAERRAEVQRELDLARGLVAPSRAHARLVERMLGREPDSLGAEVHPPARDLDWEAWSAKGGAGEPLPEPAPDGRLVLGAWGQVDPIKGLDLVLEAIAALPDPSRVTLHVAGGETEPAYTAKLHALAEGLDVHFHGAFDVAELAAHPVAAVHAMVSGSRAHESWGLVLDEAWHLGLPAVLPDAGAFAERAEGGRGAALYRSGDRDDLARVLGRLLDEPGALAELRANVPTGEGIAPTVPAMAARLEALYARAIEAGPPPAPEDESLRDLVRERALVEWDKSLSRRTPGELGFEEGTA